MASNKVFRVYGCDYDPNPDIYSVQRKLSRFISLRGGGADGVYGLSLKYWDALSRVGASFEKGALYPCPDHLSAAPGFRTEIYPETFREHINSGGCEEYCRLFGEGYIQAFGKGETPLLLGADHALTGGILRELLKSEPDLKVLVFDSHFDGFSPETRNGLVGYTIENCPEGNPDSQYRQYEYFGEDFKGGYDTGSFLHSLAEEGVLDPESLSVFGVSSLPAPEMKDSEDERIKRYFDEYDRFLKRGSRIIPADTLNSMRAGTMKEGLGCSLAGTKAYLSIDADVLGGPLGAATRYGSGLGVSAGRIAEVLIALDISSAQLVGMDIMEIDITRLMEENEKEIFYEAVSLLKKIIDCLG